MWPSCFEWQPLKPSILGRGLISCARLWSIAEEIKAHKAHAQPLRPTLGGRCEGADGVSAEALQVAIEQRLAP